MRTTLVTLISMILLISISVGTVFAEKEGRIPTARITLTEEQLALVELRPLVEVTIQLTQDQISIIVHNFPKVEVTELTLSTAHVRRGGSVLLEWDGRTGINPVPTP
jgi:hypothetical protein